MPLCSVCCVGAAVCSMLLSLGEGFLGSNLKRPPQANVLNVVPQLASLLREAVKTLGGAACESGGRR